jgi:adenosylmethionine-8-amino-7-oxononanoate aminotransferase
MKFKGLIPEHQVQDILLPLPRWNYGEIREGRKVIDPLMHFGAFVLGYQKDEIVDFVADVLKGERPELGENQMSKGGANRLNHISFEFADRVHALTGMKSFYSLSGSDANEGAIKLATAYQWQKGNKHKNIVVGFSDSYHGSTMMTCSVGYENFMDNPFYTLEPHQNTRRISRNWAEQDIDWDNVAAVIIEPCSYGSALVPPTDEWWAHLDKIRTDHDVVIIFDDIFTGGGKTGNYVGWHDTPIKPDISTMGKAITGGFFPLSMVLYNERIENVLPEGFFWEHGFTYSFSLAGIASAIKYLDILERDNLLEKHDEIVERAISVFENNGHVVTSRYGLIFKAARSDDKKDKHFYVIPMNADDEYFEALQENLIWFTQNTTH